MKNKKVLIINTIGLNYEGITTVIYNYLSAMDKEGLNMEVIGFYDIHEEIKNKFQKFSRILLTSERKKYILNYVIELNKILKRKYDVVHIHGNSGTMLLEVFLAKIHGVNKVLVHCHNTKTDHPILNYVLKTIMILLSDELLACSTVAGEWLYGKAHFTVLKNAIDLNLFKYSEVIRLKYRKEFNITDEYVIGHVGHFTEQKNHEFIVELFYEFRKKHPNTKLLLISDGPNFGTIKEKVDSLKLNDSVIFAGQRSDVNKLYNAMDVFIIPSLWEGLSLVTVEAQANGLQVLASPAVPKEAVCTENVMYCSLNNINEWIGQLEKNFEKQRILNTTKKIRDSGFDIFLESGKLREIYLK